MIGHVSDSDPPGLRPIPDKRRGRQYTVMGGQRGLLMEVDDAEVVATGKIRITHLTDILDRLRRRLGRPRHKERERVFPGFGIV